MQKYTYTFAADSAIETVAITAELPQRNDRVYIAGRFMQRLLEPAPGDTSLRTQAAARIAAKVLIDPLPAWLEFRVCCIDRALDFAGEVVRVVLEQAPCPSLQVEGADPADFDLDRPLPRAAVLDADLRLPARDAPWDESDGCTVSTSASGSSDPVEPGAPQAQTLPVLSLQDFADQRSLTITRPSDNHVQLRRGKRVIIEWWPSSGTVRAGNKRHADCADERAFVTLCAKEIE